MLALLEYQWWLNYNIGEVQARCCKIPSLSTPVVDELLTNRLVDLFGCVVMIDYRLQYFKTLHLSLTG